MVDLKVEAAAEVWRVVGGGGGEGYSRGHGACVQ